MKDAVAVAAGGVVGSLLRAAGYLAVPPGPDGIPWVTAGTNILGALALGLLSALLVANTERAARVHLFLTTGVLGSFTTFSALALDAAAMLEAGQPEHMGAYLLISVPGGLLAAAIGVAVGRSVRGAG